MCYSCERADMRGRERRLLGRFGNGMDREGGGGGWKGGRAFCLLEKNHSSVQCVYPTSSLKVSFNRI